MSFPAHILLPALGAVLLALALVGSWLWPAPTAPSSSEAPPSITTPVALEPPALPPPSRPQPSRPMARTEPPRPTPVAGPLPSTAAMTQEPTREEPPSPPLATQVSPAERRLTPNGLLRLRGRSLDIAMMAVESLERQRDEARARGDEAEAQRLEGLIRLQRERIANLSGGASLPAPPQLELPSQ